MTGGKPIGRGGIIDVNSRFDEPVRQIPPVCQPEVELVVDREAHCGRGSSNRRPKERRRLVGSSDLRSSDGGGRQQEHGDAHGSLAPCQQNNSVP